MMLPLAGYWPRVVRKPSGRMVTEAPVGSSHRNLMVGQDLKPRKGGIFVGTNTPRHFLFVFRRRESGGSAPSYAGDVMVLERRRKTKRKRRLCVDVCYKDATPTGFGHHMFSRVPLPVSLIHNPRRDK